MRDPAIHIKRSDFIRIMLKYNLNEQDVDHIMEEALKYTLRSRVAIDVKGKAKEKLTRIVSADTSLVDRFHCAYIVVMKFNNINISPITKKSSQYILLKEIAKQSIEFANMFSLKDMDEGMKLYVQLGIDVGGKNVSIYNIRGSAYKIIKRYENLLKIEGDINPEKTGAIYQQWREAWKKATGKFPPDVHKNPDMYVNFIYARESIDACKADLKRWINAQFDKWSYMHTTPEFSQLYGDNAQLNYEKYLAKYKDDEKTDTYFNNIEKIKALANTQTKLKREISKS